MSTPTESDHHAELSPSVELSPSNHGHMNVPMVRQNMNKVFRDTFGNHFQLHARPSSHQAMLIEDSLIRNGVYFLQGKT